AHAAVSAWLRLSTSRADSVDLVGCQSDSIAMGARRAFQHDVEPAERDKWLLLPFTGIDGLPSQGQAWVDQGLLTATVVAGVTTRVALHLAANALARAAQPPERTVIEAASYPSLEILSEIGARRAR